MIVIRRFERSCGTFKGGGGKNLVLSMTLGQFAPKKVLNLKIIKKKNDYGVDVSIVMVI